MALLPERGPVSAIVVPPGGGEQVSAPGSTLLFKAIAPTTGAAFSLHERTSQIVGVARRRTSTLTGRLGVYDIAGYGDRGPAVRSRGTNAWSDLGPRRCTAD